MSCRSHPFTHNSVKHLAIYRQATLLKDALASQNEFRDEVEGRRGRVKRKETLYRSVRAQQPPSSSPTSTLQHSVANSVDPLRGGHNQCGQLKSVHLTHQECKEMEKV